MTNSIDNAQDIIDSRDVIARIEELEADRESAAIHTVCIHCDLDIEGCEADDDWRDRGNNTTCNDGENDHEPPADTRGTLDDDEAEELAALQALAEEAEGYAADWQYGEALIRDTYFTEYAMQMAEDIGAVDPNATWPANYIDWDAAADALKQDYTSVDFDGVEYWIR